MKGIVATLSKTEALVMDPFAGTLAKAKECLSLEKNRLFIGGDIDSECLNAALQSLFLVFSNQILDE